MVLSRTVLIAGLFRSFRTVALSNVITLALTINRHIGKLKNTLAVLYPKMFAPRGRQNYTFPPLFQDYKVLDNTRNGTMRACTCRMPTWDKDRILRHTVHNAGFGI